MTSIFLLTLFENTRRPTFFWEIEDNLIFFLMEDTSNIFVNEIFKWKTASLFLKMEGDLIFLIQ
jgi:hypothetical protein